MDYLTKISCWSRAIRLLRAELQNLRKRGALKIGSSLDRPVIIESNRSCARCRTYLGRIINRGAPCRACKLRVCKGCREFTNRTDWVCIVCNKQMWVKQCNLLFLHLIRLWFYVSQALSVEAPFHSTVINSTTFYCTRSNDSIILMYFLCFTLIIRFMWLLNFSCCFYARLNNFVKYLGSNKNFQLPITSWRLSTRNLAIKLFGDQRWQFVRLNSAIRPNKAVARIN